MAVKNQQALYVPARYHQRVADYLSGPEAYPEDPGAVERVETHISWVFLTDQFAYKLKKPVRYDFLDFSTVERRREACEQEVLLNRRLAPDVYCGVLPVLPTPPPGAGPGGSQAALDWVVQMHRLPADRRLDQLIGRQALASQDLEPVVRMLARFYQQLPPQPVTPHHYRQRLEQRVRANRQELLSPSRGLSELLVQRIHARQLQFLLLRPQWLDRRVAEGRIVEGHGDLRPEHIYLLAQPAVIDCIEFNRDFRVLDVADELCFLEVECDYLRAGWVGRQLRLACCHLAHDQPDPAVLHFYKSYRACVRAKVLALLADQQPPQQRRPGLAAARRYLALADLQAATLAQPLLLVVRGLVGTGKSTLAVQLAERLGAQLLQTDRIRRDLFGTGTDSDGRWQGRYQPQARQQVYQEMFRQAGELLAHGLPVVLDGTFLSADLCRQTADLARHRRASLLLVHCQCPEPVARQRIIQRRQAGQPLSEARPELYQQQYAHQQPNPPELPGCTVDTTGDPDTLLQQTLQRLADYS